MNSTGFTTIKFQRAASGLILVKISGMPGGAAAADRHGHNAHPTAPARYNYSM